MYVCEFACMWKHVCMYVCGLNPMDLEAIGTRTCRQDRKVPNNKVDTGQDRRT